MACYNYYTVVGNVGHSVILFKHNFAFKEKTAHTNLNCNV
jgi:hypothetical protein